MSLEQIQNEFMGYLYAPQPTPEQQSHIRDLFLSLESPDPHGGMKIYRHNLVFGLIGVLKETYVFSGVLLGARNFKFFCREFLYQNPSRNQDLIQYGEGFGDFLSGRDELKNLPFIPEVARLEWALERAFYASPELGPALAPQKDLAGEESQNPGWKLKSSVQLVRSTYRIHEAWLRFHEQGIEKIEGSLFKSGVENLVVWAEEGVPRVTPVNDPVAQWLEAAALGKDSGLLKDSLEEIFHFVSRQGWIKRPMSLA